MKTIQIPMNSNPFTVVINNSVYQYKAGELIEVPDEVAEAIEDALKLEPKPKKYLSKIAQRADGSLSEINESDLEGIKTISPYALAFCENIPKVTIPNGVKIIKNHAFYGCKALSSVEMGDSITSVGIYVFDWCTSLNSVYLPKTPPVLDDVNAFGNIKPSCVFYCKSQESLEAYKVAHNWSTLAGTYAFVVEE